MPPRNIVEEPVPLDYGDKLGLDVVEPVITEATHSQKRPPMKIVWRNVVLFSLLHLSALYSLIFLIPEAQALTLVWTLFLYIVAALGITAGAHRLWSHRSYKAKLPLRILLAAMNSLAFQNDLFEWSRDHRVHHKYSETDADPHNARRGFFFSHMGWLLCKKHPDVIAKGKLLDYTDLKSDPVVRIHRKFYKLFVTLFCFIIPTLVPVSMWGESLWNSFYICALFRYAVGLNATWCVNSAAHMWGYRRYDKRINPAENLYVAFSTVGEGFHNYHHVFPHDYSTSEYGWHLNLTTLFIDTMARLGQAYDRKRVPTEVILRRRERTGDLSS